MRTRQLVVAIVGVLTVLAAAGCTATIAGTAAGTTAAPTSDGSGSSGGSSTSAGTGTGGTGTSDSGATTGAADPGPLEGPIPRPTAGGSGAGAIPAELAEFYNQQLDWQPCEPFNASADTLDSYRSPGLTCANVIVPLSYSDPTGSTVTMAVMRAPATGPDPVGSLLINPGGPGQSGLAIAGSFHTDPAAASLHERFDFIGFDTRGLAASRPLISCQTDDEKDAQRAANLRTTTTEGVEALAAATVDYVDQCVQRTGADAGIDGAEFLTSMGTDTTVKDMDVLRAVLGDEKLSYLGYSYGTLLGSTYAAQFPANVRAMVLDGAVDPNADADQALLDQIAGFQGTFEAFGEWCVAQEACPLGRLASQTTERYQELTRPLLDNPLELSDGRVLTYGDAITGTILALYSDQIWESLLAGLQSLQQGNGDIMMFLADYYDGRDQTGHYTETLDVLTAVHCMDDPRDPPGTDRTDLYTEANLLAPFQDNGDPVVSLPMPCDLWPGTTTLSREPIDASGLPTLVVISTTGDPATPYQAGVDLARQLNAALITVEGDRHTGYLSAGIDCLDTATTDYLVSLIVPPDGLTCA